MEMMRPPVFPTLETRDSMLGVLVRPPTRLPEPVLALTRALAPCLSPFPLPQPFSHIYGLFKRAYRCPAEHIATNPLTDCAHSGQSVILLPLQHGFSVVIVPVRSLPALRDSTLSRLTRLFLCQKIDLRTICQAVETYKVSCAILVPPILVRRASSPVCRRPHAD